MLMEEAWDSCSFKYLGVTIVNIVKCFSCILTNRSK